MKNLKLLTMFAGVLFSLALVSCSNDDTDKPDTDDNYSVAEMQLRKDYKDYAIGEISWDTERGFQIGTFVATPKARSNSQSVTAWYEVIGNSATREMDSKDLGTAIPEKIQAAFNATKYSNAALWRIDEVELEHDYTGNGIVSYYEIELESIGLTPKIEVKLAFDMDGTLIYTKEELDDDDDDQDIDDDKYIVTAGLKAAVEKKFPGAIIIDAEVDNNIIEVDAIITEDGIRKEIELEFTMKYEFISGETEAKYTYATLPAKFDIIKTWFTNNSSPIPTPNTQVEITEGKQTEDDYDIGVYYYEVEIDEYDSNGEEYEVEFYLGEDRTIIAVIVNDRKV